MGKEVKHGGVIGAHAGGEKHVAKLRTRRIGDHSFDVVLRQTDGGGEQGRHRADDGHHVPGERRVFEHRRKQADHIDARRHHGGGVDQGRHRRGTFHGVGQPGVQEELGRLAHGADEEEHAGQIDQRPGVAREGPRHMSVARRLRKDLGEADGPEGPVDGHDAEGETDVPDPIDHKRLDRRGVGGRLVVPKADQQIAGQPHALPAEKQLHEVGGRHQSQHGEGEERQIGEETRLALVLGHIAPAIKVDESRNGRHHHQHDRRQRIDPHRPGRTEGPDIDERRESDGEMRRHPPAHHLGEGGPRKSAGDEKQAGGDGHRWRTADPAAQGADDARAKQGREDQQGDKQLGCHEIGAPTLS